MIFQNSSHPNPIFQICALTMPLSQFDLVMISSTDLKHQISVSFWWQIQSHHSFSIYILQKLWLQLHWYKKPKNSQQISFTGSSPKNETQMHGKLNSCTFPHVIYIYIYNVPEYKQENTSFHSQTCLTPGKQIITYCLKFLSRNCWYCTASLSATAWLTHCQSVTYVKYGVMYICLFVCE